MHGVHPRGTHLALLFLEGPELGLLLCEGLRGLHAGDRLVDVGVQVALLVGELLEGAPLEDLQHAHPDDEHREQDQAPRASCQSITNITISVITKVNTSEITLIRPELSVSESVFT